MTKMQTLIREINKLSLKELEEVLKAILNQTDRKKRMELAMNEFIGAGIGVWGSDAQDYVNELREDDRL